MKTKLNNLQKKIRNAGEKTKNKRETEKINIK